MRWHVLDEVAAVAEDGSVLAGRRQRAVLAILLLRANSNVSVDELERSIWGETPPKTARNSLQRFVSDIRRSMGSQASRLVTTTTGYRLDVLPGELDLDRARQALRQGREHLTSQRFVEAEERLAEGLSEFTGSPLDGIGDTDISDAFVGPLKELRTELTTSRFQAALGMGRHNEISNELRQFALAHPASEQAWSLHMLVLYRCGRQRDALVAGEQLRQHLADEHGITPSPAIAKLTHQILNHADELQIEVGSTPAKDAPSTPPDSDLPAQLRQALRTPILGREAALTRTEEVIATLDSGPCQAMFIGGEPGIGKTRLLAEIAARAVAAGALVAYGRESEDISLPLGVWAEALGLLAQSVDLEALPSEVRNELTELIPTLEAGTGPTPDQPNDELRKARFFAAVVHLLEHASANRPVVLILDDLQWSDAATAQLVRHVKRHANTAVWVVCAYRNNEIDDHHPLKAVVASLLAEAGVVSLHLDGLGSAQIASLLQSMVPDINEARLPDFASALELETAGNPFFVSEIARDLIETNPQDRLRTIDPSSDAAWPIPNSVREVIRQRVARLDDQAARTVRRASIFGRSFRLSELAGVSELPTEQALTLLEAAVDAELVREMPEQPDLFSFSHDLVRHALYDDLSHNRKRRLHAAAASTLAGAQGPAERDARASEIARHYLAAETPALATETIQATAAAAELAAKRHAPNEAADLYRQALALLENPDFVARLGGPASGDKLRVDLLVRRGISLRNAGDPRYRIALIESGRVANELGDVDAEVEAALANTRGIQTNVWEIDEERIAQLEQAIISLGAERSTRCANLFASLASEQWGDRHRESAAQFRSSSISLARSIGDIETLANVLARASRARNAVTTPGELHELSAEMLTLTPHIGSFDPHLAINVLRTIQNQGLRDADAVLVHRMGGEIAALTQATKLPICQRADLLSDVLIAGLQGNAEEYLRLAEEALALSLEIGDPESFIAYEGHYFYGMHMLGRVDEILPMVVQLGSERSDVGVYRAISAVALCVTGDLAGARIGVEKELANGFEPGVDDYTVQGLQLWADAAAGIDHRAASAALYGLLAPHAGRLSGHVVHVTQPVDLSLGRLCRVLEDYDAAIAHFEVSNRICEAFDAHWMQAMTDVSHAQTLFERGAHGDEADAETLLAGATETATIRSYGSVLKLAERVTRA